MDAKLTSQAMLSERLDNLRRRSFLFLYFSSRNCLLGVVFQNKSSLIGYTGGRERGQCLWRHCRWWGGVLCRLSRSRWAVQDASSTPGGGRISKSSGILDWYVTQQWLRWNFPLTMWMEVLRQIAFSLKIIQNVTFYCWLWWNRVTMVVVVTIKSYSVPFSGKATKDVKKSQKSLVLWEGRRRAHVIKGRKKDSVN